MRETFLCAKYDYKMDIAVKQEEAFQDGQQQKAIEAAKSFYENGVPLEIIAKSLNMPVEQIKENVAQI
ncbi:MAG: hypothetical protein K5640_08055 [Treponema sp.]|nr:hypothetical protein [Treponema sp.]